MQATERKEKPIIFSGEMVRAILDGRKTQTRRVIRPKFGKNPDTFSGSNIRWSSDGFQQYGAGGVWIDLACPYGQPGDLLWVRETFYIDLEMGTDVFYRADYSAHDVLTAFTNVGSRWKPSIHMPRWASRLTLEVTGVRVEQVQDISEEDAKAEGVEVSYFQMCNTREEYYKKKSAISSTGELAIDFFRKYWDSLNAKRGYSWESNPWVWVVEFKHVLDGRTWDERPGE